MTIKIKTVNYTNFETNIIEVESKITRGINKFNISGYINRSIKESKDKILLLFKSNNIKIPFGRITTNLLPASLKKYGDHFDLPIAISILSNIYKFPNIEDYIICGEMGIDGKLIPIKNPLRIIKCAIDNNIKNVIIPYGEYNYLEIFNEINIYPAKSISEVISHLRNIKNISNEFNYKKINNNYEFDINDLISLESVIRALIIAITGKHNIIIKGPIGTGKTISIKSIKSILNTLRKNKQILLSDIFTRFYDQNLYIDTSQIIYPATNINSRSLFGSKNQLGEIALANFGYMCLDEINLFSKSVLDKLKIMMDNDEAFRNNKSKYYQYPVDYSILATMNPCPCGNFGTNKKCTCTLSDIQRFNKKIDKSFLDRFAIKITISEFNFDSNKMYNIDEIKSSIKNAIAVQQERYNNIEMNNGILNSKEINEYIHIDYSLRPLIEKSIIKYNLSKRSLDNLIKVSRTIADLENRKDIIETDIMEALRYQV